MGKSKVKSKVSRATATVDVNGIRAIIADDGKISIMCEGDCIVKNISREGVLTLASALMQAATVSIANEFGQ